MGFPKFNIWNSCYACFFLYGDIIYREGLKMSELSILFLILAIIGFAGAFWTRHKQKQKEAK